MCSINFSNILIPEYGFTINKITRRLNIYCKENKLPYYFSLTIYSAWTFQRPSKEWQMLLLLQYFWKLHKNRLFASTRVIKGTFTLTRSFFSYSPMYVTVQNTNRCLLKKTISCCLFVSCFILNWELNLVPVKIIQRHVFQVMCF